MKALTQIRNFFIENVRTFRLAPVEMAVACYYFIVSLVWEHLNCHACEKQLMIIPLALIFTILCNRWFTTPKKRILYYLSGCVVLPFWWINLRNWGPSYVSYWITIAIGLFALLTVGSHKDNRKFTTQLLHYVLDGIAAVCISVITWLLLEAIYESIIYIFDLNRVSHLSDDIMLVSFVLALPLLFLTFNRKSESFGPQGSKLLHIFLNWILSPAILIYTVLLYLYFFKILILWTLPDGGIALLVFCFILTAVAAQAGQTLLTKRYYDWFYNHFSLISLPALAMFWIGVARRCNEYGLTEDRVYLIAFGLIMTCCMGLFLMRRSSHYLYVTYTAIGILALFTYIPGFTPQAIEQWSQQRRAEAGDTTNFPGHATTASLYITGYLDQSIDLTGYSQLYPMREEWYKGIEAKPYWKQHNDSLFLYACPGKKLFQESTDTILMRQLAKIGYSSLKGIPADSLQKHQDALTLYDCEQGTILFKQLNINYNDSTADLTVLSIDLYLEK